jgi:hypothetical protein
MRSSPARWQSPSRRHFSNWSQHIINDLALIHQSDSLFAQDGNDNSKKVAKFTPIYSIATDIEPTKTQRDEQEQEQGKWTNRPKTGWLKQLSTKKAGSFD